MNLLSGTSQLRGCLYSLSGPERVAMEKYIRESVAVGLIHLSSSPAGAGFLFVNKKDGGLRPCINYGGLNQIIIHNRFPLPLMSSAFELLWGTKIFTYAMPTIWSEWQQKTNGRQPSTLPRVSLSIKSCHLVLPTHLLFFQKLLNYILGYPRTSMAEHIQHVYFRTNCISRIRIVNFSLLPHRSWAWFTLGGKVRMDHGNVQAILN